MARRKLSKEEAIRRMCAAMLIAVDDHRLTPEQRARAERHVRNLRAMQKWGRRDRGSGPG
jgi:hypothetical protein